MHTPSKLNLPKIRRVLLERFSLFVLQPNIDITIPGGVFCLAGANGLGKSTFLTAIGYAITGIVPNPKVIFRSAEEYYTDCLDYEKRFFDGRISEEDRDISTITVHLHIKNEIFEITRGMFESRELRSFKIRQLDNGNILFDGEAISPKERHEEYAKRLVNSIGLNSFEQYVFLQHFVLNFDERRELLLWHQTTLLDAIFLAIGIDKEKAQKADWIRKDRNDHSSYGRNYKWQSTLVLKEINNIRRKINVAEVEESFKELREKYKELNKKQTKIETEIEEKRKSIKDLELERMEYTSKFTSFQTEFSELFKTRFHSQQKIEIHPIVKNSITESTCAICGTNAPEVAQNIEKKLRNGICPLCDITVKKTPVDDDGIEALKKVDESISEVKKLLDTVNKSRTRLKDELNSLEVQLDEIKVEINNLESENQNISTMPIDSKEDLSGLLKQKTQEMLFLQKKSEEEYRLRDARHSELITLYDELRQRYNEAQVQFVPLFRELAKLFIGMDMDIRMEYSTALDSTGLQLILEMQGITRRQTYQLSESQRFFLDIALRMALAQYMSDPAAKACLFIDTPEGSLDIAYESRAGEMFARFAENGHDIIMTANINSSQILRKMASRCGKSKMVLYRMTSWAQLSSVQQDEEQLFTEAFEAIEKALEGAGKNV